MSQPFVIFAVTAIMLSGLAFASHANLGVLTRQKVPIFPFLLLPCLPTRKGLRPVTAVPGTASEQQRRSVEIVDEVPKREPVASGRLSATDIDNFWGTSESPSGPGRFI